MGMDDEERVHAERVEEWHDWLVAHHADRSGVWLVSWRTATGRPSVSYDDAVIEALAFGWVDSVTRTLDDERGMQRFSPRKPTSGWAATNKERVARLLAEGRMQPAGQAAIDQAMANGSWTLFDDVEALVVPDDLTAALAAHPGAAEAWEGFPRSARKQMLAWVVLARKPETRSARITTIAEKAARGERAQG